MTTLFIVTLRAILLRMIHKIPKTLAGGFLKPSSPLILTAKGRLLDGMGHTARFKLPSMIAVGADDAAYVTDTFNFQVRELKSVAEGGVK
eukprot:jgi/Bigna1/126736/aug1.3_g1444